MTNCHVSPFYSLSPLSEDGRLVSCGTGKADGYLRQEPEKCAPNRDHMGEVWGETQVSPGEIAGER